MVEIRRWVGRFGNNLFQYAAARLLAQKNELHLATPWCHDDILRVLPFDNGGGVYQHPVEEVFFVGDSMNNANDRYVLKRKYEKRHVIMDGYFQHAEYFNAHRREIQSWFEPCTMSQNTKDWIVHYRVGDYWHPRVQSVIAPSWHIGILKANGYFESGAKLYIVTEIPDDPCVVELKNATQGEIVRESVRDDFNMLRSFDNIICSNGSFAWWAAFLGRPRKCFLFKRWMFLHCLDLMYMDGGIAVDGDFARNSEMEKIDLEEYYAGQPSKNWMRGKRQ